MSPEDTDSTISKREVAKLRARANLLFALLSQSDENLQWHSKELRRRDDELRAELRRRDDELRAEL